MQLKVLGCAGISPSASITSQPLMQAAMDACGRTEHNQASLIFPLWIRSEFVGEDLYELRPIHSLRLSASPQ